MKIGDIQPVPSAVRILDRKSNEGSFQGHAHRSHPQFSPDLSEENGVVYQLLDTETGMILAQVPSKEVLRVASRLQQLLAKKEEK
jgi:hypothetical protein